MASASIPATHSGATNAAPQLSPQSSLGQFVETLRALDETPALGVIRSWMETLAVEPAELRPFVSFKLATYARHRVFRNEFAELLVLCWRPGQRTPIHDHNGSHGVVRVCEGVLWETMFQMDEMRGLIYESAREWTAGGTTGADVPDIHQLGNPEVSGQDLITLHLYAPPLGTINTYRVGRKESSNTIDLNSWNPTI